jgi:uncharacterized surface protein with fasciclin (FAS1) repeats
MNKANLGAISVLALSSSLTLAGSPCSSSCSSEKGSTWGSAQLVSHESMKNIVEVAQSNGSFNTLIAAAKAAGLVDALTGDGPITVLAPTDEAFAKLPEGTVESLLKPENKDKLARILTYHVIPGKVESGTVKSLNNAVTLSGQRIDIKAKGSDLMIDNAKVVSADVQASNGVIHVIDTVLIPEDDTIVGVASEAGTFNTLLAAAKAAGLADLLGSEGPFTVFAPTDEAFAKLPAGTVESLLKPENKDKLASILKYHVVPGRIYADEAIKLGEATSALGSDLTISKKWGNVKINDAKVVSADIEATNGVIHVIDSVLLPE